MFKIKFDVSTEVLQGDVLAPFLFIIMVDYVSKLAVGDSGFLSHNGPSSAIERPRRTAAVVGVY